MSRVGEGVRVAVAVRVRDGVGLGVIVAVEVGVALAVGVGVCVAVQVAVHVKVRVNVGVIVGVELAVGLGVAVAEAVCVGSGVAEEMVTSLPTVAGEGVASGPDGVAVGAITGLGDACAALVWVAVAVGSTLGGAFVAVAVKPAVGLSSGSTGVSVVICGGCSVWASNSAVAVPGNAVRC